jgi:ketosteroid isomerase-like protein
MSQENVEMVRQGFEAYLRRDLFAALAHHDADVVFNPAEESPVHGGDRVVVTLHFKGRGKGSGVEVDARSHQVHTLRDGKLIRLDEYLDRDEALEAAGLRE